ncbi:sigma-70 family RNA polymerase sigma factor [Thalassospira marina]|uniref:RNA polymerase subunit sigma n=1 Tax=Thalassospira marina TaxID=2048283 RepID=A0ABM6Q544_9PROT|nr:sigma-70 family RNA polymerase sigma factor [Thalassospira marina]AUG51617.1 RNA polymerase subunit sigma [Thalassospira marina]
MSTAIFEQQRPRLFALAFRLLGSYADAEDAVQDVWLRWSKTDITSLNDPTGWLVRVCSNLCLDVLKSARRRRENYVGQWLPEPWVNPFSRENEDRLIDQDHLSQAYLVMLEALTPQERIALVLHDVFDWDHAAIADVLGNQPNNARQILFRARRKMSGVTTSDDELDALAADETPDISMEALSHSNANSMRGKRLTRDDLAGFVEALQSGRADRIAALLAPGVTLQGDGGGKASVNINVLFGADHVARFFEGVWRKNFVNADMHIHESDAESWVLFSVDGVVHTAITISRSDDGIERVFVHRNPDKLAVFN